ncbi:hypothetical protein [Mesorhizobium australafricanum]|uniref:Major facilitator superfamily (MFS) profile domain-containing protein n=1 Tax=Mesorhizobium australafricanum TaxID=3072311 RepID=A0ABU4X1Y9_9HYPH|nr:hypothetical protein [Mesorhizobium sp. VK3E]MDX8442333.1 hypothetical protein [Mesorhizobium sp. VK3E]
MTLYIAATILFATGYGLTYSTLNAMVVNLAGERDLSAPVASQVFTLGYFVGLFGFPYVGILGPPLYKPLEHAHSDPGR